MRALRLGFGALVGLAVLLAWSVLAAHSQAAHSTPTAVSSSAQLPDRTITVDSLMVSAAAPSGTVAASITVTVANHGGQDLLVQSEDFQLSAEGDIFGQSRLPSTVSTPAATVHPAQATTRQLSFQLPAAALTRASLVYRPLRENLVASIPLAWSSAGSSPTPAPTSRSSPPPGARPAGQVDAPVMNSMLASTTNAAEDVFQRPNQTGWGVTTNPDGVPNVTWGMDGNGTMPFVTIGGNTGVYGYPGAINLVGIASAGNTSHNGGDSLVKFEVSTVGHVTPYVVENACSDKSCYYGARLHTSQNVLEIAKRVGNVTTVLATAPFTPSANTFYWMRLDVTTSSRDTLRARIWAASSSEPTTWQVTTTDASPLAANFIGAGGSWDQVGTGESIAYVCYAYATSGLAAPCGRGTVSPTATSSGTPSGTATSTPTSSGTPNGTLTSTPTSSGTPSGTATPTSTGTASSTATSTPTRSATPTSTATSTLTSTPTQVAGIIKEYNIHGVGEPWGTATDGAGDIWFAEPGCDFSPTCSATTPPGQLGELPAGSTTARLYTLPNLSGNQPIFVALDSSGNVWFTTPDNSMIGEFNPITQTFVGQWAVTAGSGPWDLTFANGKIWYTEHLVSAVGMFDPSTHTFQDFTTPSALSNPYGIAASGNLVWFTENNSSVARIANVNLANSNVISEYLIRSSLPSNLTPHLIQVDASGNPWWTEGWVRDIGMLNPNLASPGTCGSSSGDCTGVTEFSLPPPSCGSSHVSGIALQGGGSLVWLDDSLAAQVGNFSPSTAQFTLYNLSDCGAHPHDGLNLDSFSPPNVWWDEEFFNVLGELIQ